MTVPPSNLGSCMLSQVIATSRSLARLPKELEEHGAKSLLLDLCAPDEDIRQAAETAIAVYGHVDVLVNNAGTAETASVPVEELRCVLFVARHTASLTFPLIVSRISANNSK